MVSVQLNSINQTAVSGNKCNYKIPFKTIPRKPKVEKKVPVKYERINWTIPKSIFKDYQFLDESLAAECFEFDWKESKLSTWIKLVEDQNSLKTVIKAHYYHIIGAFRYLACQSANEFLSVGSNVFTDFLNQAKIFDNLFSLGDLGVNWSTVIVPKVKQPYNPGNALVRYEFMELLVRIAYDRYVRSKISNNLEEAFIKFIDEKLGDVIKSYDSNVWRLEECVTEDVDIILKTHKPILDNLYKRYSGKKTLPGQKPTMSSEEFRQLCIDGYLIPPNVPERELDFCFGLAMMIQIDEVYHRKHIEMSFIEFVEALCRISWHQPDLPLGENDAADEPKLPRKLEKIFTRLISLCSKNLKETFVFPTLEMYKSHKYVHLKK